MVPRYQFFGSGEPTIVLTHGLAATGDTWHEQVQSLSQRFRVVTWDLRGHGGSAAPEGEYSLTTFSDDLRDLLDDAGIKRAVILGHSAGGVIALRFALDHPDRTAGLVLVGTASECNEKSEQFYLDLAAIAETRGMEPVRRRLGLGNQPMTPADPTAFAKMTRCMAGLRQNPLTSEAEKITCPTLVVVGEKDFLGAGGSVILSRRIPGSRLEIVPGRGHGLFLEDAPGFNEFVSEFVSSLRTA